ncbi:MAG TPA: hypothetical protein VMD47_03930 [Candidatus Acidoferrales bacterium]|nr:hypothetical protein [Candidatus Acidoferrales bacterium]
MNRSHFLAGASVLAAGNAAAPAIGAAIPGGTNLVERRAQFDETAFDAAVGRPAAAVLQKEYGYTYAALTF